jgi:hypothetical protein
MTCWSYSNFCGFHLLSLFLLKFMYARRVCAMSALSLLDLFISIQLNILGRHVYFDTAKDLMNPEVRSLSTTDANHIFFTEMLPLNFWQLFYFLYMLHTLLSW